jgi:hypothetical protein
LTPPPPKGRFVPILDGSGEEVKNGKSLKKDRQILELLFLIFCYYSPQREGCSPSFE